VARAVAYYRHAARDRQEQHADREKPIRISERRAIHPAKSTIPPPPPSGRGTFFLSRNPAVTIEPSSSRALRLLSGVCRRTLGRQELGAQRLLVETEPGEDHPGLEVRLKPGQWSLALTAGGRSPQPKGTPQHTHRAQQWRRPTLLMSALRMIEADQSGRPEKPGSRWSPSRIDYAGVNNTLLPNI